MSQINFVIFARSSALHSISSLYLYFRVVGVRRHGYQRNLSIYIILDYLEASFAFIDNRRREYSRNQ